MPQFVRDVEDLRDRARRKIDEGPVTDAYRGDKERTISILNEALATEIVCVLRYMHHYFMATGVHGKSVAAEFKEHADAESEHADLIAERIQQLGGKPDYNPKSLLERSASQYVEGETLADMIREDLVAERVVIEVYSQMIRFFGEKDPTTRVIMEGILKDEEEHAADLADLLYIVDPHTGKAEGVDPGTHPLDLHAGDVTERSRQGRAQEAGGRKQEAGKRPAEHRGQPAQGRRQEHGRQQAGFGRGPRTQPEPGQTRDAAALQPQPGSTFAGSDTPNPPGIAGSRAARERDRQRNRGKRIA